MNTIAVVLQVVIGKYDIDTIHINKLLYIDMANEIMVATFVSAPIIYIYNTFVLPIYKMVF